MKNTILISDRWFITRTVVKELSSSFKYGKLERHTSALRRNGLAAQNR
jgi:hypothetical protein